MRNRFDFRRFINMMWYTWVTQPLLPYIVMLAMVPFIYTFLSLGARSGDFNFYSKDHVIAFCFYLVACGWLYAGTIFYEYGKKSTSQVYMLLPASQFEKWLAKALLTFIVFPALLILFFQMAMAGFNFISIRLFACRYSAIDWGGLEIKLTFFIFYMAMPAAFTAGLIWRRFGFFKGIALSFILMMVLFNIINAGIEDVQYSGHTTRLIGIVVPPFALNNYKGDQYLLVLTFWVFSTYIPALLFALSSWFLMKSKEI